MVTEVNWRREESGSIKEKITMKDTVINYQNEELRRKKIKMIRVHR